jgi:hypothetical protein
MCKYFALIPFTGNCKSLKFETAREPLRKSMERKVENQSALCLR